MGFQKPSMQQVRFEINKCITEISSPYNDGWTSSSCKKDLYLLKCWLDDVYKKLPTFAGEETWEQERIIEMLKKNDF